MKDNFMKVLSYLSVIILFSVAQTGLTKDPEPYVDLRDINLKGTVIEVSAPNLLKIETFQHGKKRFFWVDLVQVDFGRLRNASCLRDWHEKILNTMDIELKKACKRMQKWAKGDHVQIEVTEWDEPTLKGFVFKGQTNINYAMIEKGWYRVDYRQTRDASLALLEKEARCQHRGIWKHTKDDAIEALKCQD